MIILFSGSHGTGKSSVAKRLSETLGYPMFTSQAAEIHRSFGVTADMDIDPARRITIQSAILNAWIDQLTVAKRTGGIFDRTPIDMAAYALADVSRSLDGRISNLYAQYIKHCVNIAHHLPSMFLCTHHGGDISSRGADRPDTGNEAYSMLIQSLIIGLLHEGQIKHTVLGQGTVDQRVDLVGRTLSAEFDTAVAAMGRRRESPRIN